MRGQRRAQVLQKRLQPQGHKQRVHSTSATPLQGCTGQWSLQTVCMLQIAFAENCRALQSVGKSGHRCCKKRLQPQGHKQRVHSAVQHPCKLAQRIAACKQCACCKLQSVAKPYKPLQNVAELCKASAMAGIRAAKRGCSRKETSSECTALAQHPFKVAQASCSLQRVCMLQIAKRHLCK